MKPGFTKITMADYLADPCPEPSLSSGCVKTLITRTAYHAKLEHPRFGARPSEDTAVTDIGRAAHALTFGGQPIEFIDADNWRTKAARQIRDDARADGRVPLLEKQRPQVEGMADAAKDCLSRHGLTGEAEVTGIWEEDGTWFRMRPDLLCSQDYILDLKTTVSAEPMTFIRSTLVHQGYDIQAAFYSRGAYKILGENRDFVFLVQEREYPFLCSLVGVGPALLELAQRKVELGIKIWRQCMASGVWPGYRDEIHWADPPSWVEWDIEARELAHDQ